MPLLRLVAVMSVYEHCFYVLDLFHRDVFISFVMYMLCDTTTTLHLSSHSYLNNLAPHLQSRLWAMIPVGNHDREDASPQRHRVPSLHAEKHVW